MTNEILEGILAGILANLEGREFSAWSPTLGAWMMWAANPDAI